MGQFFKIGAFAFAGALLAATPPALAGGHFGGVHMAGAGMVPPGHVRMGVRPAPIFRPGVGAGVRAPAAVGFRAGFHAGYRTGGYGYGNSFYGYRRPGYAFGYALPHGRPGYDYGYALPQARCFGNCGGLGYGFSQYYYTPGYGAWPTAAEYDAVPPYPVGYYGASYTPTGNGVIYDLPLPPERLDPKIIYVSEQHHAHGCKGQRHLTVIRGGEVSCE